MQVTARDVIKLLKENGFEEVRVKGSHHRFVDEKGHKTTVPYHKLSDTIVTKTYYSILKQAGLK